MNRFVCTTCWPDLAGPASSSWFLFWLGVIQLVVWLVGRPRSIAVIKSVHTIVFVILSALLAILFYEVVADRDDAPLTWLHSHAVPGGDSRPDCQQMAVSADRHGRKNSVPRMARSLIRSCEVVR